MADPYFFKRIRKFQRILQDEAVRRTSVDALEKRAEFFVDRFQGILPAASRVLDIGGGWGFYAEPLERRGHQLTVLDVVKPALQKAPVVIYEGGRFPFPDKSFDASLMVTMLHHVPDPEAVIREAGRVTRRFLIVVEDLYHHALGRFWTVLRDRLYNFEFFGHPCQFRKKEEWVALFAKLGYTRVNEEEVYTRLAGLRILNGILVFEAEIATPPMEARDDRN